MDPILRRLSSSTLGCIASLAAFAGGLTAQEQKPPPADYTVHEWGTFTSMVGRDGIALEGLQHEEEALPPFVHDLLQLRQTGVDEDGKLPASHVTQKMETPVIYFHTDAPMRVAVRVWFMDGLMSQFYPLPTSVAPLLDEARQQLLDLRKIRGSSLSWDVELIPHGQPAPPEIPHCAPDQPWQFAREVDAAYVRTIDAAGSCRQQEAEHYLFYRGLGRWTPPLRLQLQADDGISLHNGMNGDVPFLAVLEIGDVGGRFCIAGPMRRGADQPVALGAVPMRADRDLVGRELGAHLLRALVQQGLNLDEARAMVATWSRSWFQKPGTRVIYLLPRQQIDQVLPLWLQPEPQAIVRVMVGRLEYITKAAQARVERALTTHDEAALAALDRFLEPQLRNIVAHGSSETLRRLAADRLAADRLAAMAPATLSSPLRGK